MTSPPLKCNLAAEHLMPTAEVEQLPIAVVARRVVADMIKDWKTCEKVAWTEEFGHVFWYEGRAVDELDEDDLTAPGWSIESDKAWAKWRAEHGHNEYSLRVVVWSKNGATLCFATSVVTDELDKRLREWRAR